LIKRQVVSTSCGNTGLPNVYLLISFVTNKRIGSWLHTKLGNNPAIDNYYHYLFPRLYFKDNERSSGSISPIYSLVLTNNDFIKYKSSS